MFAMNATLKPRAMAAYTGSSSNMSRERVLRASSIGRSSDDPSSRRCEGRWRTSIDSFTNEEQEPERRWVRVHGSMTVGRSLSKPFEWAVRVGAKEPGRAGRLQPVTGQDVRPQAANVASECGDRAIGRHQEGRTSNRS